MKRKLIATGAAIASLFMDATVQATTLPVDQTQKTVTIVDKEENKKAPIKQSRAIQPDGVGGLNFGRYDRGLSPKEYGQWLQSTRRQKWNKKQLA